VIFPTAKIQSEFQELTGLCGKDIVIPWGIPDYAIENSEKYVNGVKSKKNILYAGRLDENKNVEVIINSLKFIDSSLNLTIIGEGSQKTNLINLSLKSGLEDRVTFEDFMPRRKLWSNLKNFDCIIVSTKEIEAFCLMAIEAQAFGLPLLYARTSGLVEVIGNTGIVFDPNDAQDLAKGVSLIMSDEKLFSDCVMKGYKNAKKFKISTTRKRFLEETKEILT
jgi:glycosyltransferase involved in cell wall biosynthesis